MEVGISIPTAFYWRHKILTAMRHLQQPMLEGIVEADETFFLESQKGSRHLTRPARTSGGIASVRGLSHHQVCVLVARDRQKTTLSKIVGRGVITEQQVQKTLGGYLKARHPCTDGAKAYRGFAKNLGVDHQVLKGSRNQKKGI